MMHTHSILALLGVLIFAVAVALGSAVLASLSVRPWPWRRGERGSETELEADLLAILGGRCSMPVSELIHLVGRPEHEVRAVLNEIEKKEIGYFDRDLRMGIELFTLV